MGEFMGITNSNIQSISNGDIKEFKLFFETFYPSVCAYARNYLEQTALVEDFAQEAFVEYWNKKKDFDNLKAVKAYIYKITRNKCLNHIRLHNIHKKILQEQLLSEEYSYEHILQEETYALLYKALNNLTPQSRKIMWLSLYGNTNEEIANQLDISINTVKTLKKNAYKKLRIQLKGSFLMLVKLGLFCNQ